MDNTFNMQANDALLKKLEAVNIKQFIGKIHKDSYLQVGLDFYGVDVIGPQILSGAHFSDWVNSKGWPEGYVPLAIYSPDNDEQEEIFMDASGSDTEEFFAINQNDPNYPVFMWNHSAGFDKWASSIEVFLKELS